MLIGSVADFLVHPRSIQHCLPIAVTLSVNSSFVSDASFTVNSTDLRSTYNVHPYVENGNLVRQCSLASWSWLTCLTSISCSGNSRCVAQRLALNGTVQSQDLVNVTIQLPPAWAVALFNATITGSGYVNVRACRLPTCVI